MTQRVYVVSNPELGWDCIVAVYDWGNIILKELQERYPEDEYVIHERILRTDIGND